jgi:hypothetical protein
MAHVDTNSLFSEKYCVKGGKIKCFNAIAGGEGP